MNLRDTIRKNWPLVLCSLAFPGLFLLGWVWPEPMWGSHGLKFIAPGWAIALIAGAALLLYLGWSGKLAHGMVALKFPPAALAGIFALLYAVAAFNYPFPADLYGDAPKFNRVMQAATQSDLPPDSPFREDDPVENLRNLKLWSPRTGEITVLNSIRLLTPPGGNYRLVTRRWNACWGALFAFCWLFFLLKWFPKGAWEPWLWGIAILATPLLYQFGGHVEVYAPILAVLSAFGTTLALSFRFPGRAYRLLLIPLYLLALKLHASSLLLTPVFGLAMWLHFADRTERWQKWWTLRRVFVFILGPILIGGILAYFFFFQSAFSPRALGPGVSADSRIFLPLGGQEVPYDRYTLFHPNHLLDYFNLLFLVAAPALLVIGGVPIGLRRIINWNRLELTLPLLGSLLYLALFFAVNPLLGMPMDWDLFALNAPLLLLVAIVLFGQISDSVLRSGLLGSIGAIAVLSLTFHMVHFKAPSLGERLVYLGSHTYKTYWIHSVHTIRDGIMLQKLTIEEGGSQVDRLLREGEPYAMEGNDIEYARLLQIRAKALLNQIPPDPAGSRSYLVKAQQYAPHDGSVLLKTLEAEFLLRNFDVAYQYAENLVEMQFPTEEQARRIAVHCALAAGNWEQAEQQALHYLQVVPHDATLNAVISHLRSGENPALALQYFN